MAKLIVTTTVAAAPDHIYTRSYSEGEEYEIGSEFMPQWLATMFLENEWAKKAGILAQVHEAVETVIDKSQEKPVAKEPGPSEVKQLVQKPHVAAKQPARKPK